MFINAKIGDKVFSYPLQEWGIITKISNNTLSIYVKFDSESRYYTRKGKLHNNDKLPLLFWDEVKPIAPPQKPLPKLKVDTKVLVWDNDNKGKLKRYFSHFDKKGNIYCFDTGMTSWSINDKTSTCIWGNWELVE